MGGKIEYSRRGSDKLIDLVAIVGIFGLVGSVLYSGYEDYIKKKDLIEKISIVGDSNKDGVMSESEWIDVYRKIEVPYDSKNLRNLTNKEMEIYLEIKGTNEQTQQYNEFIKKF